MNNLKRYIDMAVKREIRRVMDIREKTPVGHDRPTSNPYYQKIKYEILPDLERITNHWSGELPNLYSSVDKIGASLDRNDPVTAHRMTVKLENELKNNYKSSSNPDAVKRGLGLIMKIRALLAKSGF
jgi:hypothetical protein